MLLVLNVVYQGMVAAHVARDHLHRNRTWACVWLKRYRKEGTEGLQNKPKSGRPPELSDEIIYKIKTMPKKSNGGGWTTKKQVEERIVKMSGKHYHHTHICRINTSQVGFYTKSAKESACQYRNQGIEERFQKKAAQIPVNKQSQEGFTIVSLDESFFFYDSLIRRVWIDGKKRPVVRITGSHKYTHMYFWSLKSGRKTDIQAVRWVQQLYVHGVPKDNS